MKKSFLTLLLVCLLSAPALAAIKVGVMCPLTGKWASEGQDMKNIVNLLVQERNSQGGINGESIELVVEDDAGDPRTAALAAQKLASAGVVAVIGTYGSAVTEASQNILDESGIVQIGTGSTSVRLTEKGLPLFFRTCPRDDAQGQAAAQAIVKGGYKNIALLHDNSSYAKGLAEESRAELKKAGVNVIFFDALTPGERDYNAILTKLKSANPDLVFFTGYYPETGMLLRQKKEMGWNVPMMGGDAANHQDLVKIAGNAAAKGYFFVSPPLPQDLDSQAAKDFLAAYKAKYNSVPVSVWAVLAGDAFKALENAFAAGHKDSEAIAAYLHKLSGVQGFSGEIGFDAKGDRIGKFYRTYIVDENGRFILQAE
ncbi:MAG: branched-chain amino acid ABC transporter substrate-binding protein [Desulfovibrio sp.]|nr:branched-chain amino acid ABC transporter substrate-binding protein [Desulfovibrio sp.]